MNLEANFTRREFLMSTGVALLGASTLSAQAIASPDEEPIIDIHQHTDYMGRTDEQLIAHQKAMGVTTTILLPAGTPAFGMSTHQGNSNGLQAKCSGNDSCYNLAMANGNSYLFGANEVPDLPDAVDEIERYLRLGAHVIGESKFGVQCDSPEMQKIYQLAEVYNVPVLMHWQYTMYNHDFDKFYKMLEKYPNVNFIGHAQTWWANIDKNHLDQNVLYPKGPVTQGGLTDRLLADYPNIYADMSAGSGLNALQRDEDHTRGFLERHQDKILYGSDCLDKEGHGPTCQGSQTIAAIRKLSSNKSIERKILYENARKLFRLS